VTAVQPRIFKWGSGNVAYTREVVRLIRSGSGLRCSVLSAVGWRSIQPSCASEVNGSLASSGQVSDDEGPREIDEIGA